VNSKIPVQGQIAQNPQYNGTQQYVNQPQTTSVNQNASIINQTQMNGPSSYNNPSNIGYQSPNNSQINQASTSQVQTNNISPLKQQEFSSMQHPSPYASNLKPNLNELHKTTDDDEVVNQENTASFDLGIKFNMQI
jgi:hypothetical protein